MSTTYSNPKEMLGYIVVKFIDSQLPLLGNIPYDRRAVFSFYYQLKGLDVQLISFREDMKLILEDEDGPKEYAYYTVMKEINEIIRSRWQNVYAKDYEEFMGALFKWAELIASCYPKLGLVPESDTYIEDGRENEVKALPKEMEEPNEQSDQAIQEYPEPTPIRNKIEQYRETNSTIEQGLPGEPIIEEEDRFQRVDKPLYPINRDSFKEPKPPIRVERPSQPIQPAPERPPVVNEKRREAYRLV